jgi:hypothetical protein
MDEESLIYVSFFEIWSIWGQTVLAHPLQKIAPSAP